VGLFLFVALWVVGYFEFFFSKNPVSDSNQVVHILKFILRHVEFVARYIRQNVGVRNVGVWLCQIWFFLPPYWYLANR
jgi:hypothetical protein